MEYRSLSDTGLEVSKICLGTMTWGQQNTEDEAHEQLSYATEHGVNFIDTAELYPVPPEKILQGRTESYIGTWLAKRGKRDDLIITSKVAASNLIQTREVPANGRTKYDRKNIMSAIEGTLDRLQTDYVDLYQIHWPERETNFFGTRGFEESLDALSTPIEETLEVLAEIIHSGKARFVGVSNETAWGVGEYLRLSREKRLPRIVSIQNQYSLTNRTYEIGLSEITMRENVGLLVYSALNMGVLTGKYLDDARPAGARFTRWERNKARYNPPHAQVAIRRYIDIARKHGLDPAQMALAFAGGRPFVTSVIIGATSIEQLKTDIAAGSMTLSDAVMADIHQAYTELPDPTC